MRKLLATCLAAGLALSMTTAVDAQTTQTITVTKKAVKVTHQQCVMMRMSRAKTERARTNAEEWCTKRGDTVPRHW
jgi:hypothetical protein